MNALDYAVVAGYLLAITAFGSYFARFQKNTRNYFLTDNSTPWWGICFTIVATETSTLTFIGVPAAAYAGPMPGYGYGYPAMGYGQPAYGQPAYGQPQYTQATYGQQQASSDTSQSTPCTACGAPLTWYAQYNRWYCNAEARWL